MKKLVLFPVVFSGVVIALMLIAGEMSGRQVEASAGLDIINTPASNSISPFGEPDHSYFAQSFIPPQDGSATQLTFGLIRNSGDEATEFHVLITETVGGTGSSIRPSTVLFESGTISHFPLAAPGDPPIEEFTVDLGGVPLTGGTTYAIVLDAFVTRDGVSGRSGLETKSGYPDGHMFIFPVAGGSRDDHFSSDWIDISSNDLAFDLIIEPPSACDGNNHETDNVTSGTFGGPFVGINWQPEISGDISRLEIFTGLASGNMALGIWSDAGGQPGSQLGSTGDVAISTTNSWQGGDLNDSVTVSAGSQYWVVIDPVPGSQAPLQPSGTGIAQSYWGSSSETLDGAEWFGPFSAPWKFRMFCTGEVVIPPKDITDPVITGSRSPAPTSGVWNNEPVTVSFACTDADSGVASLTDDQTINFEVQNHSVSGTCIDNEGNQATVVVGPIYIDLTAPTITASRDIGPNANQWNNTQVKVTFNCDDPQTLIGGVLTNGSGIASCTAQETLGEGGGQSSNGTAVDVAGNSASVTEALINIDLTKPTITASRDIGPNANQWNNSQVKVTFTCERK